MTCARRRYDVQKTKWRPFSNENKQLLFSNKNPVFTPENQKYFTWVFIRVCTIVSSSDMTSFVYIDDEKHHLSKWFGKEKTWPQQKEIVLSLLSD